MLNNDTFQPLDIFPSVTGGTLVTWQLRPAFRGTAPYTFTLEWAEHENGDWITADGPMVDTYFGIDDEKRTYNVELESCYRVKMVTATNVTLYSEPKVIYGNLNRHDWLIARDIIRKENLRVDKYTGEPGFLLRRKIWGVRCTVCREWDTGDITDSKCGTCYGTGIVGGYYDATPMLLTPTVEGRKKKLTSNLSEQENIVIQGRVINMPMVSRDDIWISTASSRRYYIHKVQNVASMRGTPLVANLELRQAPFSDPAYDVSLSPSSSSSSVT